MLPLDICSTPQGTPTSPEKAILLYDRQGESRHFQEQICQYNSSLAFTSVGATSDPRFDGTHGSYVFKFSGEVQHQHGAQIPSFLMLVFLCAYLLLGVLLLMMHSVKNQPMIH